MIRSTVAASILLVGCASPPPFYVGKLPPAHVRETPWGTIEAASEEVGNRMVEILSRFDPLVREYLETSREGHPIVSVGLHRECSAEHVGGYADSKGIVVFATTEGWEELLVHELVHWHLTSHWGTLPCIVEEGVATSLSWSLCSQRQGSTRPPSRQAMPYILEMSFDEYLATPEREQMEDLILAGVWIVNTLGMEKLEDLARAAYEQGLATIPTEWFLEALPSLWGPASLRCCEPDQGGIWPSENEDDYWPLTYVFDPSDSTPHPLVIRRRGKLEATITRSGSTPIPGARLRLHSVEFDTSVTDWLATGQLEASAVQLQADAQGRVFVHGIPHGTYSWTATGPDGATSSGRLVVPPGATLETALVIGNPWNDRPIPP